MSNSNVNDLYYFVYNLKEDRAYDLVLLSRRVSVATTICRLTPRED